MQHIYSGKVRDLYADGDDLILVASDRMSIYDVVLPTPIPDKGKILTQLSLWWFGQLTDIVPNHVISASDVPPEWAGRAIRCRRLEMIPVECIARGYLAGLGLASYQKSGSISGVPLPPGLTEGAKLPEPVFTPTTKAAAGHDEPLTYADTASVVEEMAAELERITLEIYGRGAVLAAERGVLIADTKLEFGRAADGSLMLADEVLTPDSSRSGPPSRGCRVGRSILWTSNFCATGRRRSTGTGPRPGRQSPRRSWRPPGPDTWTYTSGSPARPGKGDGAGRPTRLVIRTRVVRGLSNRRPSELPTGRPRG